MNSALLGPKKSERIQLKQIEQLSTLVPIANQIATAIMHSSSFNVIDFWKRAIQSFEHRSPDGCHWSSKLHRELSFQIISFLELHGRS